MFFWTTLNVHLIHFFVIFFQDERVNEGSLIFVVFRDLQVLLVFTPQLVLLIRRLYFFLENTNIESPTNFKVVSFFSWPRLIKKIFLWINLFYWNKMDTIFYAGWKKKTKKKKTVFFLWINLFYWNKRDMIFHAPPPTLGWNKQKKHFLFWIKLAERWSQAGAHKRSRKKQTKQK